MKKLLTFLIMFLIGFLVYSLSTWYLGTFDLITSIISSLIISIVMFIWNKNK